MLSLADYFFFSAVQGAGSYEEYHDVSHEDNDTRIDALISGLKRKERRVCDHFYS